MYEIGSSAVFGTITPGMVSDLLQDEEEEEENATEPPVTVLPKEPKEQKVVVTTEPQVEPGEKEQLPTGTPREQQPSDPAAEIRTPGYAEVETDEPDFGGSLKFQTERPERITPNSIYSETVLLYPGTPAPRHTSQTDTTYGVSQPSQPTHTVPDAAEPAHTYVQAGPPEPQDHRPQLVVDDEDLNVNGESGFFFFKNKFKIHGQFLLLMELVVIG